MSNVHSYNTNYIRFYPQIYEFITTIALITHFRKLVIVVFFKITVFHHWWSLNFFLKNQKNHNSFLLPSLKSRHCYLLQHHCFPPLMKLNFRKKNHNRIQALNLPSLDNLQVVEGGYSWRLKMGEENVISS